MIRSVRQQCGAYLASATLATALVVAQPPSTNASAVGLRLHSGQIDATAITLLANSAALSIPDNEFSSPTASTLAGSPAADIVASADSGEGLLSRIFSAVVVTAGVPLWYLAFPVTAPLSVLLVAFSNAYPIFNPSYGTRTPLEILIEGVRNFLLMPILAAGAAISAVFTPPGSSSSAAVVSAPAEAAVDFINEGNGAAATPNGAAADTTPGHEEALPREVAASSAPVLAIDASTDRPATAADQRRERLTARPGDPDEPGPAIAPEPTAASSTAAPVEAPDAGRGNASEASRASAGKANRSSTQSDSRKARSADNSR